MEEKIGCRPEIDYPCQWQFRIIGEDRAAMLQAVSTCISASLYTVCEANVSSGGRFLSLNLEVAVNDDAERLHIYQLLAGNPAIRMVL
jgi:hypothetical protein